MAEANVPQGVAVMQAGEGLSAIAKLLDQMATQSLHQDMFIDMLQKQSDEPEHEALIFALRSSKSEAFEARCQVEELVSAMIKRMESAGVANV
jgi:hypothetical protein